MFRLVSIALLVLFAAACSLAPMGKLPADRPNIVLLIGDDHGYPYFGFQGSDIVKTPAMDSLAEAGTVFSFGHSSASVCAPALRTLLTGFYPYQMPRIQKKMKADAMAAAGGEENLTQQQKQKINMAYGPGLMKQLNTLPRLLAKAGYASLQTGKYWEGDFAKAGFDDGMSGQIGPITGNKYKGLAAACGGDGPVLTGRKTMQPIYDFVDKYEEQPFFVWYAPMLPHTPHNPPPELRAIYENEDLSESAKTYYAMCTWFDKGVGELTDYIEKKGLTDNTLFIYICDNGWDQEPQVEYKGTYPMAGIGGRLGKLGMHDMGFRTPVVFKWPGKVPAGARDDNLMVSAVDLFPTILDVAGVAVPENVPGKSLSRAVMGDKTPLRDVLIGTMGTVRHLMGEAPKLDRKGSVFGTRENATYVRSERWHYIRYEDRNFDALYDKVADPNEKTNVAEDHPEVVKDFRARIEAWKAEMTAPFQ